MSEKITQPTSDQTSAKSPAPSAAKGAPALDNRVEVKAHVKSGKMKGRKVTVLLDADDLLMEQVGGFIEFLREYSVVGLAIGFIAGSQAQAVVKSLVDNFITPAFMVFTKGKTFDSLKYHQSLWRHGTDFHYGKFIYALLNLIFVLAVIYVIVKVFKLDKLKKKS